MQGICIYLLNLADIYIFSQPVQEINLLRVFSFSTPWNLGSLDLVRTSRGHILVAGSVTLTCKFPVQMTLEWMNLD